MSINLISILKEQVLSPLASQVSPFLNENEIDVKKGLNASFPSLLAAVMEKGSTEKGASELMQLMNQVDVKILDNPSASFSNGQTDNLLAKGAGMLDSLLGNKQNSVVDLVAKISNLKSQSVLNLFKMATPFLMALLSKEVSKHNLGLTGFMEMLANQKEFVLQALPSGMAVLLGYKSMLTPVQENLTAATKAVSATQGHTPNTAMKSADDKKSILETKNQGSNTMFKWLIPVVLILAAVYLTTQSKMCEPAVEIVEKAGEELGDAALKGVRNTADMSDKGSEAVAKSTEKVKEDIMHAIGNVNNEAKAQLDKIQFAAGTAGSQMMNFLQGDWAGNRSFPFKTLTFAAGSAAFTNETGEELDNLAVILKTYPDIFIEIQGHTDNSGDAEFNKTLSLNRANAVKARLQDQGIAPDRIETIGYGSEKPRASNDTPEGQEKNRRIEVRITN